MIGREDGGEQPSRAPPHAAGAAGAAPPSAPQPEASAPSSGGTPRRTPPGQHLLRHEVTEAIRAAAVAALGSGEEAGRRIFTLQ